MLCFSWMFAPNGRHKKEETQEKLLPEIYNIGRTWLSISKSNVIQDQQKILQNQIKTFKWVRMRRYPYIRNTYYNGYDFLLF